MAAGKEKYVDLMNSCDFEMMAAFKQLEDAFSYLMLCNKTTAVFRGLEIVELVDYPEEALRDALLNALVHRDYSFSGSIIINVNDNNSRTVARHQYMPTMITPQMNKIMDYIRENGQINEAEIHSKKWGMLPHSLLLKYLYGY